MVEKTSDRKNNKVPWFLKEKKMVFFSRASPTRNILDNSEAGA